MMPAIWACDGTDQHGPNVRAWPVWANPAVCPLFNMDIRLHYTLSGDTVSHSHYTAPPNTTPYEVVVDTLLDLVEWWRGRTSAAQGGVWPSYKPFRWGVVCKGIDSGGGSVWSSTTRLLSRPDDATDPAYAVPSGTMSPFPASGIAATKPYFDKLWPYLRAMCQARGLPVLEVIASNNEFEGDLINNAYSADGSGGYTDGPFPRAVSDPRSKTYLIDGVRTLERWLQERTLRPDGQPYGEFAGGSHQSAENRDLTQRSIAMFRTARLHALHEAVYKSAIAELGCRVYEWNLFSSSRSSPAYLYSAFKGYDMGGYMPLTGSCVPAYGAPEAYAFDASAASVVSQYGHGGAIGGATIEAVRAMRDFTADWAAQCAKATGRPVCVYPQFKHTSTDAVLRRQIAHEYAEMLVRCVERAGTRDVVIYQDNADGYGDLEGGGVNGNLSAQRRDDFTEMCRVLVARTQGRRLA